MVALSVVPLKFKLVPEIAPLEDNTFTKAVPLAFNVVVLTALLALINGVYVPVVAFKTGTVIMLLAFNTLTQAVPLAFNVVVLTALLALINGVYVPVVAFIIGV